MIKEKLDRMFWKYAEEKFVYGGTYPYYTELVFAFADYIENLSEEEMARQVPGIMPERIRRTVRKGTDRWLRYHAKTMFIL